MAPYPKREIRTEKGSHRLHEIMSTLIPTLVCVQTAFAFRAGAKVDWEPGVYMSYESRLFDSEVRLPQGGVLEVILAGQWINSIEVGILEKSWNYQNAEEGTFFGPTIPDVLMNVVTPFFIAFYEEHISWIRANVGNQHTAWPDVWRFGRVVRNAASHNAINIADKAFVPVSWYSLTYGPDQDGRRIFGTDLPVGDLIILMLEMNDALDRLGAPI